MVNDSQEEIYNQGYILRNDHMHDEIEFTETHEEVSKEKIKTTSIPVLQRSPVFSLRENRALPLFESP